MNRIKEFGIFWYDFLIGDDWKIAFGVLAGLGLSALLVHLVNPSVWWLLPLVVIGTLAVSLRSSTKRK